MRILLSSENFDGLGGTETYMLTVAAQLDALGHEVAIYSPHLGAAAQVAADRGLRVAGAAGLPRTCDLLVFGDAATCHELAPRYSGAVRLFVMHSRDVSLQAVPQLEDRCHAVVVLNDRVRSTVEASDWHAPIVRLRQPIDTSRFRHLGPPGDPPRRALVLSNRVAGHRAALIERACRANGIESARVGVLTSASTAPEHAIANSDFVVGVGRSALEGMAAGRPVYLYDNVGGDGWVTLDRYPAMEADGFAGLSDRQLTIDLERMTSDFSRFDPLTGEVNMDLVQSHHDARQHAVELVELARALDAPQSSNRTVGDELARLVRLEWHASATASSALAEAVRLRTELDASRANAASLRAELTDAYAAVEAFRRTRRYRLAQLMGRILDLLRKPGRVGRA